MVCSFNAPNALPVWRVAVCCTVLQCVAVCCSVLQCNETCCSALQCCGMLFPRSCFVTSESCHTNEFQSLSPNTASAPCGSPGKKSSGEVPLQIPENSSGKHAFFKNRQQNIWGTGEPTAEKSCGSELLNIRESVRSGTLKACEQAHQVRINALVFTRK